MNRLIIIGASGHGLVAADIAKNRYEEIIFLDDNKTDYQKIDSYEKYLDSDFFVAIGNNEVRRKIFKKLSNLNIVSLIHPTAIIGSNVQIGRGTIVCAGAIICPNVKIGESCILNTACSVDHESNLGDFVHVSVGSRVCGNGRIGNMCMLGAGSVIINNITIASDTIIGAGGVVIKDITSPGTYAGVPVKRIR